MQVLGFQSRELASSSGERQLSHLYVVKWSPYSRESTADDSIEAAGGIALLVGFSPPHESGCTPLEASKASLTAASLTTLVYSTLHLRAKGVIHALPMAELMLGPIQDALGSSLNPKIWVLTSGIPLTRTDGVTQPQHAGLWGQARTCVVEAPALQFRCVDVVAHDQQMAGTLTRAMSCLLYTSPSPRDRQKSRMPSSA